MRGSRAGLLVKLKHATAKEKHGRAGLTRDDFYVLPGDTAGPARLESFERRFFGGKACRIMLRGDRSA